MHGRSYPAITVAPSLRKTTRTSSPGLKRRPNLSSWPATAIVSPVGSLIVTSTRCPEICSEPITPGMPLVPLASRSFAPAAGRMPMDSAGITRCALEPIATDLAEWPECAPCPVSSVTMPPSTDLTVPAKIVLRPMNFADEQRLRPGVEIVGRADLLDAALVHHDDAVGERQRLGLRVGHEDEGDAESALQQLELVLDALAQIGVERAERLVEQQDVGLDNQRAGERDALLLAARQAARGARRRYPCKPECLQNARRPCASRSALGASS